MGWENGHKEIKTSLQAIADFINEHKPAFESRLDEMRTLWKTAWNCHDYVSLKNLVVILKSKSVQTGFNVSLDKKKRYQKRGFAYVVTFSARVK